jgi:hypothetical protein
MIRSESPEARKGLATHLAAVGLGRWFLFSGFLGVVVALALMILASYQAIRPAILLVLWPSSIAGLADPATLSDKILVALFEFGGNFILYGAIGTPIGFCFRRFLSRDSTRTE